MKKLEGLRALLIKAVPFLTADPGRLAAYVDKGRIAARTGRGLSFEYRYTGVLVVEGYAGDLDGLFVPVLAWIAGNEPELLDRAPQEPFAFEIEMLDDVTCDVSIEIALCDRVRVDHEAAGVRVTHLGEPPRDDAFDGVPAGTRLWQALGDDIADGTVRPIE